MKKVKQEMRGDPLLSKKPDPPVTGPGKLHLYGLEKYRIEPWRGCAVSIVHICIIFHSLYIFEEIFFDLVFKCVDIVGGFQVR